MTDMATLYVRNIAPETVARIRRRAEARGLTVAQYLERLEALHADLLAFALSSDAVSSLIEAHNLGRVVD